MKETTEAIDPDDLRVVRFALRVRVGNWRPLAEALMGAGRVIVLERDIELVPQKQVLDHEVAPFAKEPGQRAEKAD